jgi:ribosomal protein L37AE/L43A
MEARLPDCPDCGGDMMGFAHPLRPEVLVWACRCCGATFIYDAEYRLQPLPVAYSLPHEEDQEDPESA